MSGAKRIVLLAAAILFAVWLTVHWNRVTGDADATIRFTLGVLFALLVTFRHKNEASRQNWFPNAVFPGALVLGVLSALMGIIFRVHMAEWAGVLLLLFACCFWVAPRHYRSDLALGFFVLFWVHPLPGQIFGWMQGGMQRLSVIGSEHALHILNVRVWGDGIMLRAGYQNFLVPEACSGMRTSVTVFLCALGVGLLLRLRYWETLSLIVIGLFQVLLLNIARISYLVLWAPRMPPEWAENYLHDSLGGFLLAAIVLVQCEAVWWRWWTRKRAFIREGIRKKELERPDKASIITHSLRRLIMIAMVIGGIGFIAVGVFAIAYKSRAYHRKEMIREVAEGLMETDPVSALRAFQQIRQMFPEDRELITLHASTLLTLEYFEEGLELLQQLTAGGRSLGLRETVMKSWALTQVNQHAEPRALIDALSEDHDHHPGVAMLRAEFAVRDGDSSAAARHLRTASASHVLLPRIRALFPYMARHEQWSAIVEADHDRPYADLNHAMISIFAHQQLNNLPGMMRVLEHALDRWPEDPNLLSALFNIAQQRPDGQWVNHLENNLRANIERLAIDGLAAVAPYGMRLQRPEWSWLAYARMQRDAPDDPELLLIPPRYGSVWMRVRRHHLGLPSETAHQTLDLGPLLSLLGDIRPFREFRNHIPLLDEAQEAATSQYASRRQLQAALEALEKRDADTGLNERMLRLLPPTLATLDRFDEAHKALDRIRQRYPERTREVLLQHANFYDRAGRWQASYEKLQAFRQYEPAPDLQAGLLEISALMNLNQGVVAMHLLERLKNHFPGAERLALTEAAIWDSFGFRAEALHVLSSLPGGLRSPMAIDLFYATGRTGQARRLRTALGLTARESRVRIDPPMWLPSALLVLTPRWPPLPEGEALETWLGMQREAIEQAESPFFRKLHQAVVDAVQEQRDVDAEHMTSPEALAREVERWEALGNHPKQAIAALYELATLAARRRDVTLAVAALKRLLEHAPTNRIAWRALVALSGADPATVLEAAAQCPDDPDLFLAELLVRLDSEDEEEQGALEQRLDEAISRNVFPPETLIRAGDVLLARGHVERADRLARRAVERADGLLASHVLALRTAIPTGRADRALTAAMRGVELAPEPTLFYRVIVEIKASGRETDADLLSALEHLREAEAEQPRWAGMLGALYFDRGNMRRSLTVFRSILDRGEAGTIPVSTWLMASEAARLDGRPDQALRLLEEAYAVHPDNVSILNNLVYLLAQDPAGRSRARALVPRLLELGSDIYAVLDTAAVVMMHEGNLEQAQDLIERALELVEEGAYGVHEIRLNAAVIQMRSGQREEARRRLEALRRDPARPNFVDQQALRLLRELDRSGPNR